MDIAAARKDTQEKIQEKIKNLESKGEYWTNVQPINYEKVIPVTKDYNFLPRNPFFLIWSAIVRAIAILIGPFAMLFVLGGRTVGKRNLRGLKGFVAVCNHVHTLDNMLVRQAVFGHRLYITVAEFNNMKGFLGSFIRAAGTLPFSSNVSAVINLQKTISYLLKKNCAILGYPERALWYRYEKPRPLNNGMFHIAVKNKVPVVPMFITFEEPSKFRKIFSKKKCAKLNILKPIFPNPELSDRENISEMMKNCSAQWEECYKEHYKDNSD